MKCTRALAAAALLLAVMAISAHARVPTVERVCEPNTSWNRDCNDCICTENMQAMCTKRDCSATTARPTSCRPGETWRQGCNTCTCGRLGVAACTQMACLDQLHEPSSPAAEPAPPPLIGRPGMGARCRAGQVWMEDCNSCRCAGGRPICTMMACLGSSTISRPSVPRPIPVGNDCTPGDTWKESCNSCRCSPSGRAMCTMMACIGKRSVDSSSSESSSAEVGQGRGGPGLCEPGSTWKRDCNTCLCGPEGLPACTKMHCVKNFELGTAGQPDQLPSTPTTS